MHTFILVTSTHLWLNAFAVQADIALIKQQLEHINMDRQQQQQQQSLSVPSSPSTVPGTPPTPTLSQPPTSPPQPQVAATQQMHMPMSSSLMAALGSLRGPVMPSLAGTRGPVWQWFARKLGSHIRARAETLARHFGTPLCLLVFWKKDVLADVDILIAKANVSVDSKGGDADGPLHAHRFKAMFIRGDTNGFYRVALDFKHVRDPRVVLDSAPFLLTFDFRREHSTEHDPPAMDLFWMSVQQPRPEGSKWYVGVLEHNTAGTRWAENYNVFSDQIYPSLVPPSVLLAVQAKQHQDHQQQAQHHQQQQQQRAHEAPQRSPRMRPGSAGSPRLRHSQSKDAGSPSLPNLGALALGSSPSPSPALAQQRHSPPTLSLSLPPGLGNPRASPKRERESTGHDSPPSKISPTTSPGRARELASQHKAAQAAQQAHAQTHLSPIALQPHAVPLAGMGWQRGSFGASGFGGPGSFGVFAAPPAAAHGPQPVGYVLQPSSTPGQPPSLVPVYSNPPVPQQQHLAATPPHVFVNSIPLSAAPPTAFNTLYPPPPFSFPGANGQAGGAPSAADQLFKIEK